MKTNKDIEYKAAPYGTIATIPKGTSCIPASNLPPEDREKFWAEPWAGMGEKARGWQESYGFLLDEEDVEN